MTWEGSDETTIGAWDESGAHPATNPKQHRAKRQRRREARGAGGICQKVIILADISHRGWRCPAFKRYEDKVTGNWVADHDRRGLVADVAGSAYDAPLTVALRVDEDGKKLTFVRVIRGLDR